MSGIVRGKLTFGGITVCMSAALTVVASRDIRGQEPQETTQNLMYLRGQSVIPSYEGWHPNADGTIDLWFGYLNENWQEELDIPIGPSNVIEPAEYATDAGQPTHFLPRNSRWVFAVRVPKDFGSKEVVWTLTSHGQTYRTYATLKPGYIHDDMGMQREYYASIPAPGNKPPELDIEGSKARMVKVGEAATLTAVAIDDGLPKPNSGNGTGRGPAPIGGRGVGGDGTRGVAKGLRLAWFVYRGANVVTFDPPQFKTWEDQRGGSPWAPSWVNPPIPPGNTWVVHATFRQPGTYVLRCQASDGLLFTQENVTFTVTP
jgi:hypothetical protein